MSVPRTRRPLALADVHEGHVWPRPSPCFSGQRLIGKGLNELVIWTEF